MSKVKITKKIFIKGTIECKTGLHIGGSDQTLSIGGVDNVVVRDPMTNTPYVPGSSIKGKMRSLLEKYYGLEPNSPSKTPAIYVPQKNETDPNGIRIGEIFGVPAEIDRISPTRLIVRDAFLTEESKKALENLETDLPYSEVKTEVTINRVSSKANPRQMERVPAGTEFGFEFILNVFAIEDGDQEKRDDEKGLLEEVFKGMQLLQDDYLGGSGSRGYGKIKFHIKDLAEKTEDTYKSLSKEKPYEFEIPEELK